MALRGEFIAAYNTDGIKVLDRTFKSGNCCFAVKGGKELTIASSRYGFQFLADMAGALACSPDNGLHEQRVPLLQPARNDAVQ